MEIIRKQSQKGFGDSLTEDGYPQSENFNIQNVQRCKKFVTI